MTDEQVKELRQVLEGLASAAHGRACGDDEESSRFDGYWGGRWEGIRVALLPLDRIEGEPSLGAPIPKSYDPAPIRERVEVRDVSELRVGDVLTIQSANFEGECRLRDRATSVAGWHATIGGDDRHDFFFDHFLEGYLAAPGATVERKTQPLRWEAEGLYEARENSIQPAHGGCWHLTDALNKHEGKYLRVTVEEIPAPPSKETGAEDAP